MELIVGQNEAHQAVVPVRWCLNQEDRDYLARRDDIGKPFLLMVFAQKCTLPGAAEYEENYWIEYKRELVPLFDVMHYVELPRPGDTTIFAGIVHEFEDDSMRLRKKIMREKHTVLDSFSGKLTDSSLDKIRILSHQTSVSLEVPEEFFAKQPGERLFWWENLWFERKPVNQCQRRRRAAWAYTVQPFAVGIWVAFMVFLRLLCATAFLIHGARNIRWHAVPRPFRHTLRYTTSHDSSVFFRDNSGEPRSLWMHLLYPPLVLGVAGASFFVTVFFGWQILAIAAGVALVAALLFPRVKFDKWINKLNASRELARAERRDRKRKAYARELEFLSCDVDDPRTLSASPENIPPEKQTIKLRFQEAKAEVCKPLARR